MNTFFIATYVLLFLLILLETLIVYGVLRKAMWFQRFYTEVDRRSESPAVPPPPASSAPQFSLPSLEVGKILRTSDLQGKPSVLCFVSPEPIRSHETLRAALHAWWHRMQGRVYLVCSGAEAQCRDLVGKYVEGFPLEKIAYDEAGGLAREFQIADTPMAVELDGDAQVKRYGYPEDLEAGIASDGPGNLANHRSWPHDRPMSGAGFARVDTTVSCVLSRFRLNSPLSIVPFYFAFRRVRRAARDISGLIEAVFLIEGARTCYTLSMWKDDWSIVEFGSVRAHIDAANSVFAPTYRKDTNRSEIWSAQFRLWAVSCHNLDWKGLDMKAALGEQWQRREELAQTMMRREEHTIA